MRRALFTLPLITLAASASAQEKPDYTVVAGDTCEGVAKKVYGDPKRYDLLHEANPELGPMPHHLKAGMVLRTPARSVSIIGRNTQGVRLIDLDEGDRAVSLARLEEQETEGGAEEQPAGPGSPNPGSGGSDSATDDS